jgi:hypothetical protein
LITSGRRDPIFPPAGYRPAFQSIERVYDLYVDGENDRMLAVDANVGHTDAPRFLHEARRWFCRWLATSEQGAVGREHEPSPASEPAANLVCLTDVPRQAANYAIHDHFIRTANPAFFPTAREWELRRRQLLDTLKQLVFQWFPREPCALAAQMAGRRSGYADDVSTVLEVVFDSEPKVPVRGVWFKPKQPSGAGSLLILVKGAGENVSFPDCDHLLPLLKSSDVLVLNPRFTETVLSPAQYSDLERTAALTGRTIAAMQVWDVIRAVRWAFEDQKLSPSSVHVFGRGAAGIVALYAALFEERICQVILSDPPVSHWQGPALLTILRHTDIPEVAGLLAPRRLTFLRQVPAGFELTRQLFGVAGAETNLRQMDSLAEAVWL